MRIWIDGYEANVPDRLGSGQYAFQLISHLETLDRENEYTILLPGKPSDDLPKTRTGWKYKILKPSKFWTRIALPLALYTAKIKPDLIFSPTHYIPRFSPVPRVCTIFDLSYLHFQEMFKAKDLFQLKNWTKYSIENAEKILAISSFTKEDIVKNYNIDPKKIVVTHLGYDKELFKKISDKEKIKAVQDKYSTGNNYIIYIGTIQPRKNLVRLIKAFKNVIDKVEISSSHKNLKLVIVGKTKGSGRQGWKFDEILEAPKKLGIENKVVFTGFVPNKDLIYLLSGSLMYVLPSLWEGFGIPVLEAMASGTAVIASNVSSLPEVMGNAGVLIDPYSVESIAKGMESLLIDEKLRQKKVQLGLERAKKFSWENCALETLEVFKSI